MISKSIQSQAKKLKLNCQALNHQQTELTIQNQLLNILSELRPDNLIHLAAYSGNLNWNQTYPHLTFENNIRIGLNVFHEWFAYGKAKKAINVIPSCAYPDYSVLMEHMLWQGKCNYTIESHGLARRCIEGYTRQLNKVGARIITCAVNNSFGPNDSFDPAKTKVIGGLITKFVKAVQNGDKQVVCWGTGKPLQEFIYCDDVAKCLLQALDVYEDYEEPINITSGQEVSIKELAETIGRLTGFTGDIVWDTSKPDGQNQKKLSTKKMEKYINVEFTPLETALNNTINWYKETQC